MRGLISMYLCLALLLVLQACGSQENEPMADALLEEELAMKTHSKGKLFIIGGGKRTESLMNELVANAGLQRLDSVFIITAASSEPDTSFYYACESFPRNLNLSFVHAAPNIIDREQLHEAKCIYLAGGDQRRLMDSLSTWSWVGDLKTAFQNGACVAGTSAGAAVMSDVMITGDQLKHDEYQSTYALLQRNNAIYETGLGLLPNEVIIDQHFVARSRYNRALTALHDYPKSTVFGIDESTALVFKSDTFSIAGEGQVLVFRTDTPFSRKQDFFSNKNIELSILVSGDSFYLN